MANRVAKTYSGGATGGTHEITFTPATPGARLILVISSYFTLDALPEGWTQDHYSTSFNHVYVLSRIATGTETSVALTMRDTRLHAVLHERDDCARKLFNVTYNTTLASMSATATVPADAVGRVFSVVNAPNGSAGSAQWNNGLTRHFTAEGAQSYSAFAHGAMPAPGSQTFTISNLIAGTNTSVFAVVGYGSTDSQAPTAPGNLRATSITGTQISVEWDAATDNTAVAGYGIYKDGLKQGTDQTSLTCTFTALVTGRAYTFEVDAVDPSGNRSAKAQLSVMAEVDVTPPTTPANLRLVEATLTSLQVAWDASTDNVGVAAYGVYLNGLRQGADHAELEHTIIRLARGTEYTIAVDAADSAGNRSPAASLTVSTLAGADPSAPLDLTASPGKEQITVGWRASDPGELPVARYEVLLDGQLVATTTSLGLVLEDLDAGATYEIAVRAVDTGSARGPAAAVTVTVPPAEWVALASPVYRLGNWTGNARDVAGVEWIVEEEDGWASGAEAITLARDSDTSDGGFSGPGKYGGRTIALSGVARAPSRMAMLAAQEQIVQALYPHEAGILRVAEAHMTRQARVRLANQVDITDMGGRTFTWGLVLRAPDPRRYAPRPVHAEVEFAPAQTSGSATITLAGDYPGIPANLRLIGPVANPVIRLDPLGLEIRAKPGTILTDERYELTIDLATREVWAIVPPDVFPEPRLARSVLARYPARFSLQPGMNTITLSGALVAGQESKGPRLVIEVADAWI
ncbi:fibronectin type III domain-containing protein [Nonomuraea sp. NPDC026600]|uniref:fibronectin type III domain-containing protein n=1 Tax=Nonomuraea sp. NPDC026600 TaxID=3155363 RepID=UPI00340F3104